VLYTKASTKHSLLQILKTQMTKLKRKQPNLIYTYLKKQKTDTKNLKNKHLRATKRNLTLKKTNNNTQTQQLSHRKTIKLPKTSTYTPFYT
jgi:hypothetical protein